MKKRDRDDCVTSALPVLVGSYDRRDGFILPPDGLQIEAQILPLCVATGIFDQQIRRKFKEVYDEVSDDELTELRALAFLVSAVVSRKPELVKGYDERMAPLETKRALARLSKEMERWGDTVHAGQEREERARVLRNLQERVKFPWHEMNWRMNEWLRKANVVLWLSLKAKGLLPGLYCGDMAAALAALLLSRVASPKAVVLCGRCGTPFVRGKRVQRFCSLRCGNADRKARERAKIHRRTRQ